VIPFCQVMIDAIGWRWAFRILGIVIALWTIPAALILVRDPPPCSADDARRPTEEPTLAGALAHGPFWVLAIAQFCGNFVCQMLLVHQVAFLVDQGIPVMIAASAGGLVGLSSVFAKVGSGWAADVIGRRPTFTTGMVFVLLSVGLLDVIALSPHSTLVYIGHARFGAIFGALHLANAVGGAVGAWLAGVVFDTTGSYTAAFAAAAIAAVMAIGAVWMAQPTRVLEQRAEQ